MLSNLHPPKKDLFGPIGAIWCHNVDHNVSSLWPQSHLELDVLQLGQQQLHQAPAPARGTQGRVEPG